MSEEQPSKPNGTSTDPMKRLASLKPSRDLSLGGAKPNKKIFTPNLNVARNKNKGASTSGAQPKREDRNQRDRRDRNRNSNRDGSKIIKSAGVFSEGLGAVARSHGPRGSYSSGSYRDGDPAPVLQKPTIRVKDVVKIDKELEEQKIRSVMGDGDTSGDMVADFTKTTERDAPIKLPMGGCRWPAQPKVKVKEEVIVKTEPQDDDHFTGDPQKLSVPEVKREPYDESEVVDLLRSKEPTLILLQLPDTLPGRGGSREQEAPQQRGNKPNTATVTDNADTNAQTKPVEGCHLSDLEEGRIGTLRTHRSGRVTLLLGDTVFEVNMGTTPAFHQELVSVSCEDSSRSASLVSLGAVRHSVNIVPQWETLLKQIDII